MRVTSEKSFLAMCTTTLAANAAPDVTGLSPLGARLRGWLHDKQLSGEIIVEQNIHVLDCFNRYA
jgi:hypothetical protein